MACESQLAECYIKQADRIITEAELLVAQQNVTLAQMAEWYAWIQYWACMAGSGNRVAGDATIPTQSESLAEYAFCKDKLAAEKEQLAKLLAKTDGVNFSGHQLAKLEKIRKYMEGDAK